MRLAVLRNPVSTGNLGRDAPDLPPGAVLEETEGPRECAAALTRLAAARPDLLVIDGGDGTVRDAISRFREVFDENWPAVAVLANGNTNLVAARHGATRERDLLRLASLSPDEVARQVHPAPVLRVDTGSATLRGFIAGWGAYAAATRMAREEIRARHGAQVVRAVLGTLRRALVGPEAAALRRGIEARFAADGAAGPDGRRFLGIATTLPGRLIGPLAPFWGGGEGPVRWLDVLAPPRHLAVAAPLVALGRPPMWMRGSGYRSGRAQRLDLRLQAGAGLVLDGEAVAAEGDMTATISGAETVRWLRLRPSGHST